MKPSQYIAAISVAFLAGAADAESFSGLSSTWSANLAKPTQEDSDNIYGFSGALHIPFVKTLEKELGMETFGAYRRTTDNGSDLWNIGSALLVGNAMGRLATNFSYHSIGGGTFWSTGAGAAWFVTPSFDLNLRGGTYIAGGDGYGYVGGQGVWYLLPNLSLSASVDYANAGAPLTSKTVQAEWLLDESAPISGYVGYQRIDISSDRFRHRLGGDNVSADIVFFGIKLYLNGNGASSLVERQRTGTGGYIVQPPHFLEQY